MPASHPGFPPRPCLRPGVRVTRRRDGRLQIGLDPALAVTAPDDAATRTLLGDLRHGVPPPPPSTLPVPAVRLCEDLLRAGLVTDADALLTALGRHRDGPARESCAARYADLGLDADRVLTARARVPVAVTGDPGARSRVEALVAEAGLPIDAARARLRLHVTTGEPDRGLVDSWMRDGTPHVLVSACEGLVRVGPFVAPGSTACLRCLDAHHTDRDPRRPLVVEQYVAARDGATGQAGHAGGPVPEPVPHDLLDVALVWAARDATAWADGREPRTWSATVEVDPGLRLPRHRWSPHPACGCSWGLEVAG